MFDSLLKLLGFRPKESLAQHVDRYARLPRAQQDAVLDAYGEEDLSLFPAAQVGQSALNLWRSGRHEEALAQYNRAIALAPSDSALLLNRGNLHFELGNIPGAIDDFEQAVRGHPKLPDHVFVNYQMIQNLGEDSPVLLALIERRRKKRERG
jgi:tetratricopeptide (TPR) repeat protein